MGLSARSSPIGTILRDNHTAGIYVSIADLAVFCVGWAELAKPIIWYLHL